MKQKLLTIFLFLLFISGSSLFGEYSESELYVKTIYIVRVYNDKLGYRVDYQTSNLEMHSAYMPQKWFGKSGGYGEVNYGNHPSAPYMSVWYKDGKIDHFRLYVKKFFDDPSWGSSKRAGFTEEMFAVEELILTY